MSHRIRDIIGEVIAIAGADATMFEPWIRLAERLGPTPLAGPLFHDILLPTPWSAQVGVNVFEIDEKPVDIWGTAITQAEDLWGNGEVVAQLRAQIPAGVVSHWGGLWRDGVYGLKGYFGDRGGLEILAERLGVQWEGGVLKGLAVDIGSAGLTRARPYVVEFPSPLDVEALDGVAHQIITLAPEKRSLNLIFEPTAQMSQLLATAERVPAVSSLIPELIAGFPAHVRPVAYEADCRADGIQTDALVTVGVRDDAEGSHRTKGLLRLTMACNERCPFCNVPVEDYLPQPTPADDVIAAELDAFVEAGAQTLTLSGGEPTLRKARLLAVISEARQRGIPYVELQTNAVLIDPAYAEAMSRAGLTSAFVSLLSEVPEHHDTLTGLPGAHPRCLAGIDALLDAGVRVTLNPVFAALTADRVASYIDFVGERLPGVRSISLSAVQPHGRAATNVELIPDYAVLKSSIRAGRARAAALGIEILNPYCGVPLCIGWDDDLAHCVEAAEAIDGGWRQTQGIDNSGDKRQGEVCRGCALRTRCGGAWHAYWTVRDASGLEPPLRVIEPWFAVTEAEHQQVIRAPGGPVDGTWAALACVSTGVPTVWLHTDRLALGDVERLRDTGCTDVALTSDLSDRTALAAARKISRSAATSAPQNQLRLWIGVQATTPSEIWKTLELAYAVGVYAVRILGPERPHWQRLVAQARDAFPELDVQLRTKDADREKLSR